MSTQVKSTQEPVNSCVLSMHAHSREFENSMIVPRFAVFESVDVRG